MRQFVFSIGMSSTLLIPLMFFGFHCGSAEQRTQPISAQSSPTLQSLIDELADFDAAQPASAARIADVGHFHTTPVAE